MEESTTKASDEENLQFLDASDDFPFYDCPENLDSPNHTSSSQSTLSLSSSPHSNISSEGLRRRRSLRNQNSTDFQTEEIVNLKEPFKCQTTILGSDRFEPTSQQELVVEAENEHVSTVTLDQNGEDSLVKERESESEREIDGGQFSLLVCVAEFVVKAIGYQLNLLFTFASFPFWVLYYTCMLAFNPFFVLGLAKSFCIGKLKKLLKFVGDALRPYVRDWLNEHEFWFKFALRCGWGVFWSVYVCTVLVTLLISAFVIGGLMMRYYVVEEPFHLKQGLNFDYTNTKPVAFVPIMICPLEDCSHKDGNEVGNAAGILRVIPPKHKLQTTLTMVLPESDYNRNLGIFQVRLEFLSENGKSLGTFRHPSMLEFKSQPLRLLLTFFKIVPLVTGYLSETQTLKLTFRGYTEGVIPTACLKITMEQRAEFRPGAGIPEVYDAFVYLESELPFFKRILWYWRRTIFVWLSMTVFAMELLFALVCCRPAIIPRTRSRSNVTRRNPPPLTTHLVQS